MSSPDDPWLTDDGLECGCPEHGNVGRLDYEPLDMNDPEYLARIFEADFRGELRF